MRYARPETPAEASRLLASEPGMARVMAGGTDLLVQMKSGLVEPDLVVDIKHLPGAARITRQAGGFRIGCAVPNQALGEDRDLVAAYPGVVEGASLIGSTQVQGRSTVIGNLCNASPAGDGIPALIAAGAVAHVVGPSGERDVAVGQIPVGPGKTSLAKGEFIAAVTLPSRPARASDAYLRFIPRTEMDIAVCSAAVNLELDAQGVITKARVVLGAVAITAIDAAEAAAALVGTKAEAAALAKAAAAASAAAKPISDKRGTVEFRKDVVGVLARRAAKIAYERAAK